MLWLWKSREKVYEKGTFSAKNGILSKAASKGLEHPGGVLGISSDGDDRRIFSGLKFSIPGFFGVRKFGKYFFG